MADSTPVEKPPEVPDAEAQVEEKSEQPPPPSDAQVDGVADDATATNISEYTNGVVDTAPMDPNTMLNGFPTNGDAGFMIPQIDPLQAGMMPPITINDTISANEIALYDRQIRLWGLKAQEKIRSANILLIGMKSLGNEIAKNLVLAGVGVLTILDHEIVTEYDLGAQFLVSEESVGQSRAQVAQAELQKLNPRVQIYADVDIVFSKLPEYFSSFDITIATGLPLDALTSINMSCRNFNRKFYAAEMHGMYGFIFSDLIIHNFIVEKDKSNKPTKIGKETNMRAVIAVQEKKENNKITEVVTKQEQYSPLLLVNSSLLPDEVTRTVAKKRKITPLLACFRALLEFQRMQPDLHLPNPSVKEDIEAFTSLCTVKQVELDLPRESVNASILRSFLQNLGSEVSPVAAFLGGNLAQDVINVLSEREQPLQNFLLFDGEEMSSFTYSIHPNLDFLNSDMNGSEANGGTA